MVVQNVWSPVCIDALALRGRDTDGNGSLDERLYAQQDANWNVTALVSASGVVVARKAYTSYGGVAVLDAAFRFLITFLAWFTIGLAVGALFWFMHLVCNGIGLAAALNGEVEDALESLQGMLVLGCLVGGAVGLLYGIDAAANSRRKDS